MEDKVLAKKIETAIKTTLVIDNKQSIGESHIRINGEPIWFLEGKSGYWDGPYNYLEKDENGKYIWVQTTKGDKIDVRTMDMFSFCEWYNGDWKEIKNHIKVEYNYLDNGKTKKDFIEKFKRACWEFNEIERDIKENPIIKNK